MIRHSHRNSRGFSLIELMIVVLILSIVLGVVFQHIATVQRRYRQEESKMDMFQQAREAMDQAARDLHESGFPNYRMYDPTFFGLAAPLTTSPRPHLNPALQNHPSNAVGLASITTGNNAELIFEGDVDQDGQVDSVRYRIQQGAVAGMNCPCLQRSQVVKIAGSPLAQGTNWQTIVENVVALDFAAYNDMGALVALPSNNADVMFSIRTLQVTLSVQGGSLEFDTGRRAETTFTIASRMNN